MKIWNPFRNDSLEQRDSIENPSTDLAMAMTWPDAYGMEIPFDYQGFKMPVGFSSGINVQPDTAIRFIAVYAAQKIIAESIASLPFILYETEGRSRVISSDPRAWLLNEEPNEWQDSMQFWEDILHGMLGWGNSYAYKTIDFATGQTVSLTPLPPQHTRPIRTSDGSLAYVTQLLDGKQQILIPDEVIHFKAFGSGDVGISPIAAARQAIGIGIAADDHAARFWSQGSTVPFALTTEKTLNDEQFRSYKEKFKMGHQGLKNSHLAMFLDGGMKPVPLGVPNGDAQFLETRKFQVREIARLYRVPPHKIMDTESGAVSYKSVEEFNLDFVTDTIRPWTRRLEKAVKRGLFSSDVDRQRGLYAKFDLDELRQGDAAARATYYHNGITDGWLSRSEAREMEDLPYEAGLDEFLRPAVGGTTPNSSPDSPAEEAADTTDSVAPENPNNQA